MRKGDATDGHRLARAIVEGDADPAEPYARPVLIPMPLMTFALSALGCGAVRVTASTERLTIATGRAELVFAEPLPGQPTDAVIPARTYEVGEFDRTVAIRVARAGDGDARLVAADGEIRLDGTPIGASSRASQTVVTLNRRYLTDALARATGAAKRFSTKVALGLGGALDPVAFWDVDGGDLALAMPKRA